MLRAAAFALVAALIAMAGHVVGGGESPDAAVLVIAAIVVGGSVSGLAHRKFSPAAVLGMLAAAQGAFHLLFTVTAHHHPNHGVDVGRMLAFHAVAALVSGAVLARGEEMLFRLFAALRRQVLRVVHPGPASALPRWSVAAPAPIPLRGALATRVHPRRGPPVAA